MQSKILSKRTLLIVALGGFAISLVVIFHFIFKSSTQRASALPMENAVALPKQKQSTSALPVRLKIPKINVDAAVEYVGLTASGAMDVPKNQEDVAWFEQGSRPGQNGSAVIAGHYGRNNKKGSVFDNLYKLRKGDELYIEDSKGMTVPFIVREIKRFEPKTDASDVFGSHDGKSHLNLVTCEGVWDEVSKTYPERLVVFTDKE